MTFSPSKQQSAGLPDPDLTPSLNPTLARNLGRWAEVYFTTPPEQRDQAVQELLRDLLEVEQKRLGRRRPSTATEESSPAPGVAELSAQEAPESIAAARTPVEEGPALSVSQFVPAEEPERIQASDVEVYTVPAEVTPSPEPTDVPEATENWPESVSVPMGNEMSEVPAPPAGVDEISRIVRPVTEYRPAVPRPWRKIAVIASGVLLCAGLFYAIGSRTGRERSSFGSDSGSRSVVQGGASSSSQPSRTSPGARVTPGLRPGLVQPAATRQAESISALPSKDDGAQELAMAERYRTGNGVPQDSAQAVHWLWQAVSKQNGTALARLSAMYARGEGVARDCDQARVLAGAAAQKNPKGATSLLQELQAAGCE